MRKVFLSMQMSIDGYIAKSDGDSVLSLAASAIQSFMSLKSEVERFKNS